MMSSMSPPAGAGEGSRRRRWCAIALLASVLTSFLEGAAGVANGSSTWEAREDDLPAGWHSARLDSGEEFYFRQDDPEKIFWEIPLGSEGGDGGVLHTAPDTSASHDTTGAAIARQGEVIGEIELCDAGERIGGHGFDGLLAFMRKHGFHYINKHPQRHKRDLLYHKGRCQKGHNEPHIKFVEKTNRGAVIEEMRLHGKSAVDILHELQIRGIDASVQHEVEPRQPRRGKWGPDGKKLPSPSNAASAEREREL